MTATQPRSSTNRRKSVARRPRAAAAPTPSLDVKRLLLIGTLMPMAIALVNYALMGQLGSGFRRESTVIFFVWFIVQVGLVGLVVGRGIERAWLRWTIFGWIMLLINLLTFSIVPRLGLWHAEAAIPPAALFAGQIGLCVTWAFFGDGRWPIRAAVMAVAAAGLYYFWSAMSFSSYNHDTWDEMLLWQVSTLTVLCGALRFKGFRLANVELPSIPDDGRRRLAATQFGIRDVLIWTTTLAVLLGIARVLDLLNWDAAKHLIRTGAYWKLAVTTASAITIIVSLWIALGGGSNLLRYPIGVCIILVMGMLLSGWSMFQADRQNAAGAFRSYDNDLVRLYEIGPWWLGWLLLSGGLLAATLIILRTQGYRLVRQQRERRTDLALTKE